MQIGRPRVAVDPDHVVSLAPPRALKVRDREVAANVVSAPTRLEDHVVVLPGGATLVRDVGLGSVHANLVPPAPERVLPPELGVQVAEIIGWCLPALVVDIEVLEVGLLALVHELDSGARPQRKGQVAVERAAHVEAVVPAGRGAEKQALVRVHQTVSEPEEVSQRDHDAGLARAVPGKAQQALAVVVRLRHPDVGDAAGPLDLGQDARLASRDHPVVGVATAPIPR